MYMSEIVTLTYILGFVLEICVNQVIKKNQQLSPTTKNTV